MTIKIQTKKILFFMILSTLIIKLRIEYDIISLMEDSDKVKQINESFSPKTFGGKSFLHEKILPAPISGWSSFRGQQLLNVSNDTQLHSLPKNPNNPQQSNIKSNSLSNKARNSSSNSSNSAPKNRDSIATGKPNSIETSLKSPVTQPSKNATNKSFKEKILKTVKSKVPSKEKKGKPKSKGVSHRIDEAEASLNESGILEIMKLIEAANSRQSIINAELFTNASSVDVIIAIQVHNRLENLKILVQSLNEVKDIESVLVVFSHDYWIPEINDFVRSIKAFRVMQIFFPFSIQLHPRVFPGRDPRDCAWNHTKSKSSSHCLNENWPDTYKHYREAGYTQIKHHWWWKIHWLFDDLNVTKDFNGEVIFLEEDHYVSQDLLHTLKLLQKARSDSCPSLCNVLTLGNYAALSASQKNTILHGPWLVNKYNLGFSLNKDAWKAIKNCHKLFCRYDDYNWDWTLMYVVKQCASDKLQMLGPKLSRVFHIGSCGTHVHKASCNVTTEAQKVLKNINKFKNFFFPKFLKLDSTRVKFPKQKASGGWGDERDRLLCLAIANRTANEDYLKTLHLLH